MARFTGSPMINQLNCDAATAGSSIARRPRSAKRSNSAAIAYRKDRFECVKGAELLKSYKLEASSGTNRVVATCCNSAVLVNFDRGPHWVSAYRARFHGDLPPLRLRICTKFKPDGAVIPDDLPSFSGYPPKLIVKLLSSRLAMMIGR
jgi:hypothetical protein